MQNNVNTNISWYEGHNYQKFAQKTKIFKILCTKYMASSEAMTSSTHSFAYSYGLVKKCFLKICETWKCHNFLICQPIFIRFSLFSSENFTLSSEIKLDQLRTSPLKNSEKVQAKWKLNINENLTPHKMASLIALLVHYSRWTSALKTQNPRSFRDLCHCLKSAGFFSYPDNSPPFRYWSWWVVLFVGTLEPRYKEVRYNKTLL